MLTCVALSSGVIMSLIRSCYLFYPFQNKQRALLLFRDDLLFAIRCLPVFTEQFTKLTAPILVIGHFFDKHLCWVKNFNSSGWVNFVYLLTKRMDKGKNYSAAKIKCFLAKLPHRLAFTCSCFYKCQKLLKIYR
jgi:hypothetical protein